jgi:DNA-3-methyladenine glycosylase II
MLAGMITQLAISRGRVNMPATRIEIEPRGPFSWAAALDVLGNFAPTRHHPYESDGGLTLAFPLDGSFTPTAAAIRFQDGALRGEVAGTTDAEAAARQVARIFSLDHDGSDYPAIGTRDPAIGKLMAALPGLRPVCFTSPYETAAWAVISQRISMRQAAIIKERLIAEHGHPLEAGGVQVGCFPEPERLLRVESVAGLSAEKVQRLHGVARAAVDGLLDADRLRDLGDEAGPASVLSIPGIGPFWSKGIYLRGCGIRDVFPDEPLAVAALGHLHGLGDRPDPATLAELTALYRPFRMWACFLLRVAAARGLVSGVTGREGGIRRGARR